MNAKKYGLDPIAPPAICLALTVALTASSGGRKRDLGAHEYPGENIPQRQVYLNSEGNPYVCRYNATFVSMNCCGSTDSMVWDL